MVLLKYVYRATKSLRQATKSLRQTNGGIVIALGIWTIACILLYDRVQSKAGTAMEIGRGLENVANQMLMIEKVAPFVPHRPFDSNHPKMVLMLAYQRTGSTFCGEIFNHNTDYFYLYEPVDGVYSAMYGAAEGYSVPSDIAYFWNGTVRAIPDIEAISIAEILGSLLTCDFDKVPTEVLIHRFITMFKHNQRRLAHYANCLKANRLDLEICQKHIEDICPRRFGANMFKEDYCREVLWYGNRKYIQKGHLKSFQNYDNCVYDMRRKLSVCMPLLKEVCQESRVRTTKTVRVNMATAEYMFKHFTNFRVIHLIRDPRAVALSRFGHKSFRGKNSKTIPHEAGLYCNEVLRDIQIRNRIEEKFPGSVMQVIYEHIVTNPMEQIRGIYSFLNETMPGKVEKWLEANTDGAMRNSTAIAEKWQSKLTYKMAQQVSEACAELYKGVNYRWPG